MGEQRSLSVALSGGGHRATLFGLGALQYLADAGVNHTTVSISSVSGGSITNGYVGQQIDYRSCDGPAFRASVTDPLTGQIVRRGTLFAPWTTKVYLAGIILLGLAALIVPWFITALPWWGRVVVHLAALALTLSIFGVRCRMWRIALRRTLLSSGESVTRLDQMHAGTDHVICSTDLHSGRHFYFARDLAYGWEYGCGTAGDLDIATAVAGSSAFPGGFPPLWVPTRSLGLAGGPHSGARSLVLADGGVYDNMGDQWAAGYEPRLRRLPKRFAERIPDHLIVVNASAPKGWQARPGLRIPILSEIVAILADQGIQYQNTTSNRRSALVDRFMTARRAGEGLAGTYAGIEQSPYGTADAFRGDDDIGRRAHAAIDALGDDSSTRAAWEREVEANAAVATQLNRMPADRVASLVRQGYVVTMCNAHVTLGFPLLPVPAPNEFLVV